MDRRFRHRRPPLPTSDTPSETFDGFTEHFLDQNLVQSSSGVTFTVNTPTKDAGNPLFKTVAEVDDWDEDKLWVAVTKSGSTWHAFYGAYDAVDTDYTSCYASSTDGTSFTKPNLGLVTYGGNTNNNLLVDSEHLVTGFYDDVLGKWVFLTDTQNGTGVTKIYTWAGPGNAVVLVKSLTPSGSAPEGKSLVRRADGRWVLHYVLGHSISRRSLYAMVSDTTDFTGAWTDIGFVLGAPSSTNQFYAVGAHLVGGLLYAMTTRYDSSTERLRLDLFSSRDGLWFWNAKTTFIGVGSAAAWDDEMVLGGQAITEDANTWHVYYSGSPANHAAVPPRDSRIGRATIAKGRIGSVGTTGNVVAKTLTVNAGSTLTVNANASGGTLKIEVQDSAGTPLTGYAEADFNTISTDGYAHSPTWGAGLTVPSGAVRLKFVLAAATLYGFELSDASSSAARPSVSDTFTRANDAATMREAESGHVWGNLSGTWGISSNQAYCPSTTINSVFSTVVPSGMADCTIEVTLAATTGASSGNYGLCFRVKDADNLWRWIADDANDRLYLQKRVAGTFTTVTQVNTAGIAAGAVLKVVLAGNQIDCYHNTVLKASTTDSLLADKTNHGLIVSTPGAGVSTATRWDAFTVVP